MKAWATSIAMAALSLLLGHIAGTSAVRQWTYWRHIDQIRLDREQGLGLTSGLAGEPWTSLAILAAVAVLMVWAWRKAFDNGRRWRPAALACIPLFLIAAIYGWRSFTLM
ncbi:MAG: hypothetical protein GC145_09700 [Caulobacter sp.]|nr:hypothetical protein [Caulobacter sp.]